MIGKFRHLLVASILVTNFTTLAHAGFVNGSFEQGFTGYSTTGAASIESASFGVSPTDGSSQALLQSGQFAPTSSGGQIDTFFGFPAGVLNTLSSNGNVKDGSGIIQTFSVNAPSKISFNYDFLTNETGVSNRTYDDFAFVSVGTLLPGTSFLLGSPTRLADLSSKLLPSSTAFNTETGYQTFTLNLPEAGTYILGFGVVNVGDTFINSGLLVDNIVITPASSTVPEPTSMIPLGIGMVTLAGYSVYRGKREQ